MVTRRLNDLCLPSAEDTDVTKLYHLTKSHDPVGASYDSKISITQASRDPLKLPSWDSLASYDPVKSASHDPVGSHDMDALMASLSVFDATHLGRLGTAVSMETSSMIIM